MKSPRYLVLFLTGLLVSAMSVGAQNGSPQALVGDWSGSIAGTLPLVLHVRAGAGGTLTATMDSPTQGANGLAATNVALKGTAAAFDVPLVRGSYTGTLSADGKTISGTWTQGQSMPLVWKQTKTAAAAAADDAKAMAELAKVKPSPIDGDWTGALSPGGQTLHLAFHFHATPDGSIAGTLDSLDQNAMGIPCANIKVSAQDVNLTVPAVNGTYQGKLSEDAKHIAGTWSQGTPLELNLTRK